MSYSIQVDAYGNRWIRCLVCGLGSYNPNDIEQKYCGYCHVFHADDRAAAERFDAGAQRAQ